MRYNVYIWGFSYLDYSFDVLVSKSRKLSLYNLFCSHSILLILCCFLSLGDNSVCMNSGFGDMRYMIYIWDFFCLNYSFNVLILWIHNLGLYNWFCHIYFTWCLIACSCVSMLTTWFPIHTLRFRFIDTLVVAYARHLALILPLVGQLSVSPTPACPYPRAWTCGHPSYYSYLYLLLFLLLRLREMKYACNNMTHPVITL